jgi:hypothetical protein
MSNTLIKLLTISALILLSLNLTSCSKKLSTTTSIIVKDSTVVKYSYRDSIILIPKDIVHVDSIKVFVTPEGQVNMPKVKIKSKNAFVQAEIKNNILTLEGGCDSLELKIKQLTIENTRLQSTDSHIKETVQVKYIPKFYKFCLWWFIGSIVAIAAYLYVKFSKFGL